MAGRGLPPKDPSKLAGHGAAKAQLGMLRILPASPMAQPELPDFDVSVEVDGELVSTPFKWPERTRDWWRMWAESPLSGEFTSTDWSELMDTAVLHARLWSGDHKVAGELRLRVAKFGATPEDRARLRIQFAQADEADEKRTAPKGGASRSRRGPLTSAG